MVAVVGLISEQCFLDVAAENSAVVVVAAAEQQQIAEFQRVA